MRKEATKACGTSIYIVCEGSKSEPWFLERYIGWLSRNGYNIDYSYDIYPTPKEEESEGGDEGKKIKKSGRKHSGRRLQNPPAVAVPEEKTKGGNPLYWVEHGISKSESYSEVYVVFDKDGHPFMPDAYSKAEKVDNVSIILNSRSFEYYMLLHFENIYRAFTKTECGEKRGGHTRSFHCCLPNAVKGKECGGAVCINGYARTKGYWTDSKDEHTFLTACNLWRGMGNGEKIRAKALAGNPGVPEYELNPFVDFQKLLARLADMPLLRDGEKISIDRDRSITRNQDTLEIRNDSPALPLKLENGWLKYYRYTEQPTVFENYAKAFRTQGEAVEAFSAVQGEKTEICEARGTRIAPGQSESIELFDGQKPGTFAILTTQDKSFLIFKS